MAFAQSIWMRRSLDIVLNEAKRNGATLPGVTALGYDQFYDLSGQPCPRKSTRGKRWDTSSLLARHRKITNGRAARGKCRLHRAGYPGMA